MRAPRLVCVNTAFVCVTRGPRILLQHGHYNSRPDRSPAIMRDAVNRDEATKEFDAATFAKKLREIFADIAAEPIPTRFARLLETPPDPPPFGGAASARSRAPAYCDCSRDDVVEGLQHLKTAA